MLYIYNKTINGFILLFKVSLFDYLIAFLKVFIRQIKINILTNVIKLSNIK